MVCLPSVLRLRVRVGVVRSPSFRRNEHRLKISIAQLRVLYDVAYICAALKDHRSFVCVVVQKSNIAL